MPNECTVGDFSNDEMVEERLRQYKLYEYVRATIYQDSCTKSLYPHPSNSPDHTPLDFIDSTMDFIDYNGIDKETSSDEETSECDDFLSEINEQHAIASSLRDNNAMRTDSNINDVMASSVTNESSSNTTTASTSESILLMPLPSNVFAYGGLSHLHPSVIMETRSESMFNRRRRIYLREVAEATFRPISTINMHLPNDMHPTRHFRLSEETLVEFDAFSRGLANEALRRKPEDCIIGNFTDEEMQAERIRQFKLYLHALDCVDIDKVNKRRFPHPTGNHSPLHEAVEYVTRDPVTISTSTDADELPTATRSPIERVENLLQSDVENERRKRKLRKNDSGEPVDPEASEPESEDDEDDESTEQDHEDS